MREEREWWSVDEARGGKHATPTQERHTTTLAALPLSFSSFALLCGQDRDKGWQRVAKGATWPNTSEASGLSCPQDSARGKSDPRQNSAGTSATGSKTGVYKRATRRTTKEQSKALQELLGNTGCSLAHYLSRLLQTRQHHLSSRVDAFDRDARTCCGRRHAAPVGPAKHAYGYTPVDAHEHLRSWLGRAGSRQCAQALV